MIGNLTPHYTISLHHSGRLERVGWISLKVASITYTTYRLTKAKMKKTILFIVSFLVVTGVYCQEFQQPSEGKSLVYFVRFSGTGAVINFKYFDGEKYLGKMNGVHYFTYECDPGNHIFWAAAENRDYVTGDLKPDATYILEVRPTMGAFKAAVRLHPVAPDNEKALKKVRKILSKKEPVTLKGKEDDMSFFIENGIKRFEKIKNDVKVIDSNWTFN